ncbi:MAG TPA: DUF4112 domain-containing protein [Longimicrobiaceae bacterium]|nr:DUF4112 domain-containing protein [Longimicrobiaceae bacterium]
MSDGTRPVARREGGAAGRMDWLAYLLDNSIPIPGTGRRIGIDALIGLVPGVGDLAGTALSGVILVQAARLGVPFAVLLRMLLNVGVEALVGAIPVLGDLFDAAWKANARNVALMHAALDAPGPARRSSRAVVLAVVAVVVLGLAGLAWVAFLLVRALWSAVA